MSVPAFQAGVEVRDSGHFTGGIGKLVKEKKPRTWLFAWPEAQAYGLAIKADSLQPVLLSDTVKAHDIGQFVLCHFGKHYAEHARVVAVAGKESHVQFWNATRCSQACLCLATSYMLFQH